MTTRNVRARARVASIWAGCALVALPTLYAVAGLIGGAIPANADWRPPERGVVIHLESNGVHTGIVVPKVAAGVDWRSLLPPEHLADPRHGAHAYASFGWGDRDFYLNTPSWAEVKPATVLAAALGSDRTLVHVDHLPRPVPGVDVRAVTLRPEEYRRLAVYIRATFADAPRRYRGYTRYDVFYDARGRYSARRTCNEWVGEGLRRAGVRVGRWTPFPVTVLNWF